MGLELVLSGEADLDTIFQAERGYLFVEQDGDVLIGSRVILGDYSDNLIDASEYRKFISGILPESKGYIPFKLKEIGVDDFTEAVTYAKIEEKHFGVHKCKGYAGTKGEVLEVYGLIHKEGVWTDEPVVVRPLAREKKR